MTTVEIIETCNICGDDIPEGAGHEYSQVHGTMCFDCVKAEWPDHIIPVEDALETSEIKHLQISHDGEKMHLAFDTTTGIAGVGSSKAKATKVLQKAYSDVTCVERNERYGCIME